MCNLYYILDKLDRRYFSYGKKLYLTKDAQGRLRKEWHGSLWALANKIHKACCQFFPGCLGVNNYDLKHIFSFTVLRIESKNSSIAADKTLNQALSLFFRNDLDKGIFDSIQDDQNKASLFNQLMQVKDPQEQNQVVALLLQLGFKDKMDVIDWSTCDFIRYLYRLPKPHRVGLEGVVPLLNYYKVEDYPSILNVYIRIPRDKRARVVREAAVLLKRMPMKSYRLTEVLKGLQAIPVEHIEGISKAYLQIYGKSETLIKHRLLTLGKWAPGHRHKMTVELLDFIKPKGFSNHIEELMQALSKIPEDKLEGIGKECAPFCNTFELDGAFLITFSRLEKSMRAVVASEIAKFMPVKINVTEFIWLGSLVEKFSGIKCSPSESSGKTIEAIFGRMVLLFTPQDTFVDKCRLLIHYLQTPVKYHDLFEKTFAEYSDKRKSREILNAVSFKIFFGEVLKHLGGDETRALHYQNFSKGFDEYLSGSDTSLKESLLRYFQGLKINPQMEFIRQAKQHIAAFFLKKEDALTQNMAKVFTAQLYANLIVGANANKAGVAFKLLQYYKNKNDWDCLDYAVIDLLKEDAGPFLDAN